jgi:hypothetical protein
MRFPRQLLMILIAVGLQTLPACAMSDFIRVKSAAPVEQVAQTSPMVSQFKELTPGQRINTSVPEATAVREVPTDANIKPITPPVSTPQEPGQLPVASLFEPKPPGPRPDGPLVSAIRAHLDNQYATAVNHLASFDRTNQELFLLLLPILDSARTADLSGRDAKTASTLMKQLTNATDLLSRSAPLEIVSAAFATKVVQFGVYDPLPADYQFAPGGIALLYAEIDHATSIPAIQSNGDKNFVTRLNGSLQLTDASGQVVELYDKENGRPMPMLPFTQHTFTRSPVRDYFLKIEFSVPEKPGRYTLNLEVRDPDQDRPRRVRKSVEFQVRGR